MSRLPSRKPLDAEKLRAEGDRVTEISRRIQPGDAFGEFIGVMRLTPRGVERFLDAFDHAADRVLRPLAGRDQLGVTGEDRRTAEFVLLLDDDTFLAHRGKAVGGSEPGGTTAEYQYGFSHLSRSMGLNPGPDVIILRGS